MPILSHLHQLFSADTCHAYIHTLRWKDRPRHCPRCQSHDVGPWGTYHYRPGLKRYWCHGCERTFNDLTHTLLHQSKRSLPHWMLATFLLCLTCSSRRIAREVGVHIRTSDRWCWWLRNAALSYEMQRQLAGTVEADELYHTAGNKGQAKQGGKKSLGRRARGRRSASPAVATMIKTGQRSSPGSAARVPSWSTRPKSSRNFRQHNAFEQAELTLRAALDPTIASRTRKGEFVTCFDHFDLLQTAIN